MANIAKVLLPTMWAITVDNSPSVHLSWFFLTALIWANIVSYLHRPPRRPRPGAPISPSMPHEHGRQNIVRGATEHGADTRVWRANPEWYTLHRHGPQTVRAS